MAAEGLGPEAFLAAARDPTPVRDLDPVAADLEGYLFPDTYDIPPAPEARRALVRRTAQRFREVIGPELPRITERGLTVRQVVTLASIVELETASAPERPRIAAVFLNRLEKGMPLQTDPSIIYVLKKAGRWDGNIRKRDLYILSPYNTYRRPGLPPGPLGSPGRDAIRAVLEPAGMKELYFVSRNDGTHEFSETLAAQIRAVDRYQRRRASSWRPGRPRSRRRTVAARPAVRRGRRCDARGRAPSRSFSCSPTSGSSAPRTRPAPPPGFSAVGLALAGLAFQVDATGEARRQGARRALRRARRGRPVRGCRPPARACGRAGARVAPGARGRRLPPQRRRGPARRRWRARWPPRSSSSSGRRPRRTPARPCVLACRWASPWCFSPRPSPSPSSSSAPFSRAADAGALLALAWAAPLALLALAGLGAASSTPLPTGPLPGLALLASPAKGALVLRAGRAGRDRRPPAGPALARAAAAGGTAFWLLPADRLRARGRGRLRVAHRQPGAGRPATSGGPGPLPRLAAPAPVRARGLRRSRDRRGARRRSCPLSSRCSGPSPTTAGGSRIHSGPAGGAATWNVEGSPIPVPGQGARRTGGASRARGPAPRGARACRGAFRAPPDRSSRRRRRCPRRRVSTVMMSAAGSRPAHAWSPAASS